MSLMLVVFAARKRPLDGY